MQALNIKMPFNGLLGGKDGTPEQREDVWQVFYIMAMVCHSNMNMYI